MAANTSNVISTSVLRFDTLQRCFRGLELCFYSRMPTAEKQRRCVRDPQRGAGIQRALWQRLQPLQDRRICATELQRHATRFNQALRAFKVIGGPS
jgi:hypothetical protein